MANRHPPCRGPTLDQGEVLRALRTQRNTVCGKVHKRMRMRERCGTKWEIPAELAGPNMGKFFVLSEA
jgi:hypothetical protein